MKNNNKNINKTNFYGTMNFDGKTQIATGDIINIDNSKDMNERAVYTPEPVWRSPVTLAMLTWISFIITIVTLLPIGKVLEYVMSFVNREVDKTTNIENAYYLFLIAILLFVLRFVLALRKIAKNQTRYPLFFNFAINGYGGRLVLEKIHINRCPKCGGKMKYYNKPVEWRLVSSEGRIKRQITKRVPVLECIRNANHCYKVDPAEDVIEN